MKNFYLLFDIHQKYGSEKVMEPKEVYITSNFP